jgi:phosphoribosylanthranilate isomerase
MVKAPPKIKICCISSLEEAKLAIHYGASAIGLVSAMPSGPGIISDEMIHRIAKSTPPPVATFLLTSETHVDAILAHHYRTYTNTIQLVDELQDNQYHQIRRLLPAIKIVQVIHVIDETSIDKALEISGQVDALLLDSGNPKLKIKELGGTGRVHDWTLSRKIVEQTKVPVFLAGGIGENNVREALDKVQPFGLDLCSSVRANSKLNEAKLEAFFRQVLG